MASGLDAEKPIEGGSTADDRLSRSETRGPFDEDRHRGRIAGWLIGLLALIVVGHYVCLMVLEWNGRKAESLNNAFNASLPVASGLAGSAVAYYFTRRTRGPK